MTESDHIEFAGADKESLKVHLAAEREIASAKAKGEEINYHEAVRRVELARDPASTLDPKSGALVRSDEQSADSESAVLYLAALKECEQEEGISFLEGVRRVEMARSKR